MDLELSDQEAALRDNVRMVLRDICPPSTARSVYEGNGISDRVWATMVDLGWPALAIDERFDGLGLGFVELVLVAEELGRAVAPCPFLSTTTQFVPAVRELGQGTAATHLLSGVAAGSLTGTLALSESGRWDGDMVQSSARHDGNRWILSGEKSGVLDGATADEIVIIARGESGLGAFVVARSEFTVTQRVELDPTFPLADLRLDGVAVGRERVLAEPGASHVPRSLKRTIEQATAAVAAMTVGACRRVVEMTIEYAKVREQYGRPIGSFQALKHRLVEMQIAVERATALAYLRGSYHRGGHAGASNGRSCGQGRRRRLPAVGGRRWSSASWRHRIHVGARSSLLAQAGESRGCALR